MTRTLILGADETGKSRAVKLLTREKRVWQINFRPLNKLSNEEMFHRIVFGLGNFKNGDVLVIDEVKPKSLNALMEFLAQDDILIEAQMKAPFTAFPAAVFIIGSGVTIDHIPRTNYFLNKFNFITCKENKDHSIEMSLHHPPEIDLVYCPAGH